jgi:hypothetical protein
MTERDEFGQFVKREQTVMPQRSHDAFVLVAMLVAVELMVIGACAIYGVTIGHEHGGELHEAGRAILGGVLFASGAALGVLGFMR